MRKLLLVICCLFLVSTQAVAAKKIIKIQHWKTAGGAKVYFVALPNLPILDARVIFAAGSAYDDKSPGLASLVSNMIGEGAGKQTANDISKAFDDVGAQFSVKTDRDKAVIALRSMLKPQYLKVSLDEFTKVISSATFTEKALGRVRNQTIAAIKVRQQRPGDVANDAFYETVYGKQPYAHNPLGSLNSVKQISRNDVVQFYKRYYVAKNEDIILVGKLELSDAKKIAERISSSLPTGRHAPKLSFSKSLNHDIHRHIHFPAKQTSILMGQVGINRQNPNYFPLVVGNYALGGMPLGSILFHKVRDQKGLAYYAGSAFLPLEYKGPFIIQLKTRANKTKEALSVVKNLLSDFLNDGPSEAELNAAKQNLIGGFPLALSSNASIANIVSNIAFYDLPLDYLDNYRNKVRGVNSKQVKRAFDKTIQLSHWVIVTVGPDKFNNG